jgi:hypothetical protein
VIHGTFLAFAQWPTGRPWPDAGGLAVSRDTALARDQAAHCGIRGPQAEASSLTLLEINALATSLKDCVV